MTGRQRPGAGRSERWRARGLALAAAGVALLAGCNGTSPPPGATAVLYASPGDQPPHHTAEGFRNPGIEDPRQNRGAFFKWQWERITEGLPRQVPGGWHPPVLKLDLAPFRERGGPPRIAWLGHDTFLLKVGGALVMTDPHLTGRASPLSFLGPERKVPPPVEIADLPHIDVVTVSHNHYDHMDRGTLQALNAQAGGPPLFLVPLGNRAWMEAQGIAHVQELDWWEHVEAAGLTMTLVPAQHFSARTPFDTNRTLWGGWIVDHPSFRFFHAGDTGYAPLFAEIGRRFAPIDLAAIPIGAYEPRWFMAAMHANPAEAVRIAQDVGARHAVGMHWGTFQLTDEALDEPPRALAEALAAAHVSPDTFFVMQFGEARTLPPRPQRAEAQPLAPSPAPVARNARPAGAARR